jgi:hypothetical protein
MDRTWKPVLSTSYDSWLGVMPDGRLGVGKFDEGRVALRDSNFVVAWPFLERDFLECHAELSEAWGELGEGDIETPEKLMESILDSAWSSRRTYWMQLCLPWALGMAQSDGFDTELIRTILRAMADSDALKANERRKTRSIHEGGRGN